MRMKNAFVIGSLGLVSALAFAGKPERDKAAATKPQLAAAEKDIAAACGCPVTFDVKWEHYPTADSMMRINLNATEFAAAAKKQCVSPEDKKAMCTNVKTVLIDYSQSNPGNPMLDGKTIKSGSNDSAYNSSTQFTAILSKF